ncbi:hypothetical protein TUM4261_22270 [Shewanella sp. c952]|nr:hypothetical protein TUM4261_22270 [Shewanella sp. c952]
MLLVLAHRTINGINNCLIRINNVVRFRDGESRVTLLEVLNLVAMK